MPTAVNINVQPGATQQTITLQLEPRPPQWTDLAVYAPTFPGLVVAILGLWIAHRLTVARDRRKQILELSEDAKDAVQEAEAACVSAWLSSIEDRSSSVARQPTCSPAKPGTSGCLDTRDRHSPHTGDGATLWRLDLVVGPLPPRPHQNQTVALNIIRRPKTTPVHELERSMRCKDCSQLRGYPYKPA